MAKICALFLGTAITFSSMAAMITEPATDQTRALRLSALMSFASLRPPGMGAGGEVHRLQEYTWHDGGILRPFPEPTVSLRSMDR